MTANQQQDKSRRDQTDSEATTESTEQTFLTHLIELRDRLMRSVLVVLLIFLGLFYFANDLYSLLAQPLLQYLPEGQQMIATSVISPFLTPFKLTLVLSIFVSMPFLLYQAWAFVAPGLYRHEKRLARPLLASSIVLFYLGMAFAYFVVFPLIFRFMTNLIANLEGVAYAPDITQYLDTVLKLFFAFGLAFEVPVATIIVIAMGLTTAESLAKKRPYIIVGAFVIGMLLTPPDIVSQTLLAIPMWLLFELGLIFSKILLNKPEEATIAPDASAPSGATSAAAASSVTIPDDSHLINEDELEEDILDLYEDDEFEELSDAEMEAELDKAIKDEDELNKPAGSDEDSNEDGPKDDEADKPAT